MREILIVGAGKSTSVLIDYLLGQADKEELLRNSDGAIKRGGALKRQMRPQMLKRSMSNMCHWNLP